VLDHGELLMTLAEQAVSDIALARRMNRQPVRWIGPAEAI